MRLATVTEAQYSSGSGIGDGDDAARVPGAARL